MRIAFRGSDLSAGSIVRTTVVPRSALIAAASFLARTARFDLRTGSGGRGMAGAVNDPPRAWLAAVGRADPAVRPVRRARSLEKSMVLVRLLGGRRPNDQRAP